MFRLPWHERASRKPASVARAPRFRPALEVLEDRTLLATATHLVFANQPADATTGVPFSSSVTVYAEDAFNQVDTAFAGAITVTLGNNPGNATLGGTTTRNAVAGVATFANLALDQPGTGYTLVAQTNDLVVPPIGLSFDLGDGNTYGELEVDSFSWGVATPTSGKPAVQDFHVQLKLSVADPGFWSAAAAGKHFVSVTMTLRSGESQMQEYLTYVFTNVFITSYTVGAEGDNPSVNLTLRFGAMQEAYQTSNGPVSASLNAATAKVTATIPAAGVPETSALDQLDLAGLGDGLPVLSYSWGVSNAGATNGSAAGSKQVGKASFQDFTVTLGPTALDPALWASAFAGRLLATATLNLDIGAHSVPSPVYAFSDVRISSYATTGNTIQLTLHFGAITETEQTSSGPVTGSVDSKGRITYALPTGDVPESPSANLLDLNGIGNDIPVESYSWGVSNSAIVSSSSQAAAGKATFDEFTITVAATPLDPALWAIGAGGKPIAAATLMAGINMSTQVPAQTYTFANLLVSSYATVGASTTLKLTFGSVTESDPTDNGPASATVTVKGQTSRVSSIMPPGGVPERPGASQLNLPGLASAIPVESYSWGDSRSGQTAGSVTGGAAAGKATVQDFQFTLPLNAASPLLWAAAGAGMHLATATFTIDANPNTQQASETFTFENAIVTAYTVDGNTIGLTLAFAKVTDEYALPNDTVSATLNRSPNLVTTQLPAANVPESSANDLLDLAGLGNDVPIESYSWGAANSGSATGSATGGAEAGKASIQQFEVTLAPTALSPLLWASVADGKVLASATLTVGIPAGPQLLTQATYQFTNVLITRFATNGSSIQLTLSFGTLTQTDPAGRGTVTATLDVRTNRTTTEAEAVPEGPALEQLSLTGVDANIPVSAYSWGVSSSASTGALSGATASKAKPDEFQVTLPATAADPALWAAVIRGARIATATFTINTDATATEPQDVYTFDQVLVSSYATDNDTLTINLQFGQMAQQYQPLLPGGTLGAPALASWHVATHQVTGSLVLPPVPVFQVASAPFSETSSSASLQAQGLTVAFVAGQQSTNVTIATFEDGNPPGPLSDYTATINWGDQTTSTGTIAVGADGTFYVLGSHTYNGGVTGGPTLRQISVQIDDNDGQSTIAASTAVIGIGP